jgi:hypothetical protein
MFFPLKINKQIITVTTSITTIFKKMNKKEEGIIYKLNMNELNFHFHLQMSYM